MNGNIFDDMWEQAMRERLRTRYRGFQGAPEYRAAPREAVILVGPPPYAKGEAPHVGQLELYRERS